MQAAPEGRACHMLTFALQPERYPAAYGKPRSRSGSDTLVKWLKKRGDLKSNGSV